MNKICIDCKKERDIEDFRWRSKKKGWRQSWCKYCKRRQEKKQWKMDASYRKKHVISQKRITVRNCQFVYDYLLVHPCVDCGEKDPIVLDFDHKNSKTKSYNIAIIRRNGYSIEFLMKEIKKCEVRCSNCHRRRTAKQFNWYKNLNTDAG
jgi:hypothetical protein